MIKYPLLQIPGNQTPFRYKIVYAGVFCLSLLCLAFVFSPPLLAEGTQRARTFAAFIRILFSPVCHQLQDRTFHLCGSPLTVCARCFGIYSGFFIGVLIYPWIYPLHKKQNRPKWILLTGLAFVTLDVSLSWLGFFESPLYIKSLTGFILGGIFPLYLIPALLELIDPEFKLTR